MSVIIRGTKNALRNPIRSGSIVLLLGVATAFALSLMLANQAVKAKIENLKTTGATTLSIMPAGATSGPGLQGGGEPLTTDMLEKVNNLEHVTDTGASLGGGTRVIMGGPGRDGGGPSTNATFEPPESDIDLESPIDAGSLGRRQFGANEDAADFKLPVQANGVSGNLDSSGKNYVLTSGDWFTDDDGYQAVLGKDLASHNDLTVGDTFTAYDKKFTVVGIYDAEDTFRNATVLMPLKTFQTLSERTNEVGSIVAKVDSIENMEAVETTINDALGEDNIDITSSAQSTEDAINSLKSIQNISVAGVIIAVIAAGTIVFMVMTMIVRERKKEIAVLKAIGGSNLKITGQFVTEAVVLTLCSVVIGSLFALVSSNSLTGLLVATNTTDSTSATDDSAPGTPGGGMRRLVGGPLAAQDQTTTTEDLLEDVQTDVGAAFLIQGLVAVVLIGALGSAIPAFAISKVRPAEVMRGE